MSLPPCALRNAILLLKTIFDEFASIFLIIIGRFGGPSGPQSTKNPSRFYPKTMVQPLITTGRKGFLRKTRFELKQKSMSKTGWAGGGFLSGVCAGEG